MRSSLAAASIVTGSLLLTGCQNAFDGIDNRANVPIPSKLVRKIKAKGMTVASPIMLRIFKQENELEVWKRTHTGRYAKLKSYEICKWSGKFGPKFKEGDKQAPEGFYFVNKRQMNPNSSYHLSFNMGFPNRYDRA
ncbi:MAG: L,D-transpeptidase family protein, partial [Rhizobiaceae bacterium]